MRVHVVVSVFSGCAESCQVFTDEAKADAAEVKLKDELGIGVGAEPESEHQVEVFYNVLVE